jgi:hypothetical protein
MFIGLAMSIGRSATDGRRRRLQLGLTWPPPDSTLWRQIRADRSPPPFDPYLPRSADRPLAGPGWIHEIKHDGFPGSWHTELIVGIQVTIKAARFESEERRPA